MSETIASLLENTVEDILAQIDDYGLADLELAFTAEAEGKNRAGVINGLSKKIEQLKAADVDMQNEAKALTDGLTETEAKVLAEALAETKSEKAAKAKNPQKENAKPAGPVDGLGNALSAKKTVKPNAKKGPVDGLGRPL